MKWIKYEFDDCYAIVTCNYDPINSHHMDLRIGDFVYIKEQYPGWYRGFKFSHPCLLKVFPNTHVKIIQSEIHPDLWAEIYSWIPNIRESYLLSDNKEFDQIIESIQQALSEKKFDILQERNRLTETNKRQLVSKMVLARKMLGLPIESHNEKAEKLNLKDASMLDLYTQHIKVFENNRNISGQFDNVENVSIYLKLLNLSFEKQVNADDNLEVVVSIYKLEDKVRVARLSECYTYKVNMRINQCDLVKTNGIVTKDIQFIPNHRIFLVFQFIRIGQMLTNKKHKHEGNNKFRRPHGVAVLDITGAIIETQDNTRQISIQLMQKEEPIESLTERLIQDYRNIKNDCRTTINIQFKVVRPDEVTDRHIIIHGINAYYPSPLRSRRNFIYLNLFKAEIDRGTKKSDPNFEIEISIRDERGNMVSMPIDDWRLLNNYSSVIYYHYSKPRWNELICIPLFDKIDKFPLGIHVRFLIWHRSLNDRSKNPLGVAFLKLFPKAHSYAILNNREHENAHVLTIHKMDLEQIKVAKYLHIVDELDGSMESLTTGHTGGSSIAEKVRTIGRRRRNTTRDTLSVQTLLVSNEYTFDELLANVCSNKVIESVIIDNLVHHEIVVKNIDANELKKFAIKILESSLMLLEKATDSSFLGRNILMLLGEMFKSIKNLPDYQVQMNKYINESMNFNVHIQILHELINHVPEIESNTLRASDWFMKIVVKSYLNMEERHYRSPRDMVTFNDMVDQYLQKLEFWANQKEKRILRSIVLSKAGPIINALIPVCKPIGMARLVNNLLETSRDLDALTTAGLTMDCMNSRLFLEPDCRKIILPETTRNILKLFSSQLNRIYHGREIDQDHMLDNICEKMVEFMQLHERSWQKASCEIKDSLVFELLFEHDMLRSIISIVSNGLEFLKKDDVTCKLLYKPLMVLLTVIITSLSFISSALWEKILTYQIDICNYCGSKQMTNNYDMISELLTLISQLQMIQVYPDYIKTDVDVQRPSSFNKHSISLIEVIPRLRRVTKQPWLDMLFLQSQQFLTTIGQIHRIIIRPYYLSNIIQIQRIKQGRLCCCHPSEKLQANIVNHAVECIQMIIRQTFLKLETLPPSSAMRIMMNSKDFNNDIRLNGAILIKEIWHDLDILKINFSQFFFYTFSRLTTIQNYKIRLLAVECMFDIVHLDHERKKTELITQIDQAMEKADSSYCEQMSRALKQVLSTNSSKYKEDSQLVEDIMIQMKNIQECSQHLNDNSPINGMIVINNLRKFYQKMGRSDIIGRYLFKLMTIHQKIKNFTEMGYTLLELSSFYRWSHDAVTDDFFPIEYAQCDFEWQLKARLLEESLKHFEQEDWEQGIEVCKELINGYTNFVIDFVKLSEVHKKMSELLVKIMYTDRPESLAYVIFYIGKGFPKFITELPEKSIVIITKRVALEMSMDLNAQFKNTMVEKKFPNENDCESVDKKIFFMPIKSNQFNIPSKYDGKFVKQRVLKYYENYNINEFVYKRLINNTEEDPKKRKIESCIIRCDGKLPNILSVVPVESLFREYIDPFTEALHDLQLQIRKDDMLYQDYEMATAINKDTMRQKMKDVILKYISPVSGGVTKLVEMIPERDENKLSFAGNVVSLVFALIFQYLELFDIYDNSESYNIFLAEFRKIIKAVSTKLDICEEDFNINSLPDHFNKSRKRNNSDLPGRKLSVVTRGKHSDEGQATMSRKTKIPKELLNDIGCESRSSSMLEDEHLHIVTTRPRIDMNEPAPLPKRRSTSDIPLLHGPPVPPRPRISMRANSPLTQNLEPPPKPHSVFCKDDILDDRL